MDIYPILPWNMGIEPAEKIVEPQGLFQLREGAECGHRKERWKKRHGSTRCGLSMQLSELFAGDNYGNYPQLVNFWHFATIHFQFEFIIVSRWCSRTAMIS